jgi:multidrug efflux system membrane fusion protein
MSDQHPEHQDSPESSRNSPARQNDRARVVRSAGIAAAVVVGLLLLGFGRVLMLRHANADMLAAKAAAAGALHVRTVLPSAAGRETRLTLPGTLQGINEARIFARANGYVKQWYKDIGQPVKAGTLLAILDIPEVNKQVDEARANLELATTEYQRWSKLLQQDAVSQQEYDVKFSAYKQAEAAYKRLREQQGFARVVAPFDGIVTQRNIDNGDLVNAGNGGTGLSMFATARIDTLRLYVYVPQNRAEQVRIGDSVDILRAEAASKPVKARIVRSAGAIDTATRTLQIEIQVANADHSLLPGAYVDVVLKLGSNGGLTLPTNTLLFGAAGSRVAIVGPDGRVRLQTVTVGTDYGREAEIRTGLQPDDRVIMNPPDTISDGQAVVVADDAGKGG